MTTPATPRRPVTLRLVLLCAAIAALLLFVGVQIRTAYRAGLHDGDRERLKSRAEAAERSRAPGPATPAR